jgi:hypothetical protein
MKAMKAIAVNRTRDVVMCGIIAFSLGFGTTLQTHAQNGNAWGHYKKEHRDNDEREEGRHDNGHGHGKWDREDKPGRGHAYGYYKNHGNPHTYYRAPEWQYASVPRRGAVITSAPSASISLNFRGLSLFFSNGVYYRPHANGYRIISAPIGIRINALPRGYAEVFVGNMPFYYYCGTYYRNVGGYYEVVRPPVGALVESIPNGYQTLNIDGETYYVVDGVQYKPEVTNNGEIWYRVLKS